MPHARIINQAFGMLAISADIWLTSGRYLIDT